jgi:hypothetical protein
VRDQYLMQVASRTGLEPARLRERLARAPGDARATAGRTIPAGGGRVSDPMADGGPETEALGLLVEHRDEMAPMLHEALFGSSRHVEAYRLLMQFPDARRAVDEADDPVADLLQRALLAQSDAAPVDVVVRLDQEAVRRALLRIEGQARGADDPLAFARESAWLKLRLEELEDPDRTLEVHGQLLAWLTDQSGRTDESPEGTR